MLGRQRAKADGLKRGFPDVHPFNPITSSSLSFKYESGKGNSLHRKPSQHALPPSILTNTWDAGARAPLLQRRQRWLRQIKEGSSSHTATKGQLSVPCLVLARMVLIAGVQSLEEKSPFPQAFIIY